MEISCVSFLQKFKYTLRLTNDYLTMRVINFFLPLISVESDNCDNPETNEDFIQCKKDLERDYATCLVVCGEEDLSCRAGCLRFYTNEFNDCPCQPGCPKGCPCPS